MRITLSIAGGPIQITVGALRTSAHVNTAWWTVGGRRLQVSQAGEGEWKLTGNGLDARQERLFDVPPANVRRAFREFLRTKCAAGSTVDPYATDGGGFGRDTIGWGWDDCASWKWHTPNDGSGWLPKDRAVRWMRDQGRASGIHIVEDVEAP